MPREIRWAGMENSPIKCGSLVMLSTGEYSSYEVWGLFRALKDFDGIAALREFWTERPAGDCRGGWSTRFIVWLERNGYVERCQYLEFHLLSYGDPEPGETGIEAKD